MVIVPKLPKSWTIKPDRRHALSRRFVLTPVLICWGFSTFLCLIVFFLLHRLSRNGIRTTHDPGEDMIKHFIGSKDCGIVQSDIYLVPYSSTYVTPFCKNRATLLEALSNGGRHGFDEPYVGKDCSYRWFSTPEICMILERFNAIIFVGDDIARSVYAAFNTLLREDLAFGSLQQWTMSDQDLISCKCDNQFLNSDCLAYTIDSSEKMKNKEVDERRGNPYYCDRIPHAYLAVDNTPASATSIAHFKDLAYLKPNPWQPTPVIFSFSHGSSFDTVKATRALDEWLALATGAERTVPMLFLGPTALGLAKPQGAAPKEGNAMVWAFQEEMAAMTTQKHTDVLGLYNLTLQASSLNGELFGEKVALVEAMMVINWLSKLETS